MKIFIKLLIFPLLLATLSCICQPLPENYNDIKADILNSYVLLEVNKIRKAKKAKGLLLDKRLSVPAKDHATYLSSKKKLTHIQSKKNKKNVWNRLRFFKLAFQSCGENLQFIQPQYPLMLKKEKILKETKTYERLAKVLVTNWHYSKGHYQNMINREFTHTYLSTTFDEAGGRLIAVQVLVSF